MCNMFAFGNSSTSRKEFYKTAKENYVQANAALLALQTSILTASLGNLAFLGATELSADKVSVFAFFAALLNLVSLGFLVAGQYLGWRVVLTGAHVQYQKSQLTNTEADKTKEFSVPSINDVRLDVRLFRISMLFLALSAAMTALTVGGKVLRWPYLVAYGVVPELPIVLLCACV